MNMVINTLLALSLINIGVTKAETVSGTLDIHEGFAGLFAIKSEMKCQITIKPSIINGTPYDHSNHTKAENLANLVKRFRWNNVPPFKLYKGDCSITNPMDFLKGHAAIIHATPEQEEIGKLEHYFFYLKRRKDYPKIRYSINWNGYIGYTHAQWFITENAILNRQPNGFYCIDDKKIELCLR